MVSPFRDYWVSAFCIQEMLYKHSGGGVYGLSVFTDYWFSAFCIQENAV